MKKIMISFALVFLTSISIGKTKADFQKNVLMQTGGDIIKPGIGYVAIVNEQSLVHPSAIHEASSYLEKESALAFRLTVGIGEARDAALTIRLVSEPHKPPLLVAPESGWAEINVAALSDDLKSDSAKRKFLPLRTQKMLLRAFAFVSGAGGSSYSDNVLDTVSVRDLDYVGMTLPVDSISRCIEHAARRKLLPYEIVTYHFACQEGWAPAPTNEIQKAIWDKVHEIPSKPLKIEFDPKKNR